MPEIGLGIFRPLYYSPDLLFRWKAGWAGGSFSRSSSAWYIGPDGVLHQAAADAARIEWYDLDGDGVRETPTTLLEPAATNLLLDSCNLPASGSAWGSTSNFTVSPATSIFQGQTAWRHTNDGLAVSRGRAQSAGQFGSGPQTAYVIVENVDAAETALNIRDNTAGVNVCIGRLSWATGEASVQQGTGIVRAQKLADAGPNGGPVYLLAVTATGTPGNARWIFLYPTGTSQNTQTVIIHHVQLEERPVHTSPIVTTTAPVTRAADSLRFPWSHPPQAMTIYLRFIEVGATIPSGASRVLLEIGAAGIPTRIWIGQGSTASRYSVTIAGATGSVGAALSAGPAIGDLVELICRLYPDGSVQIEQSINGGTPTVSARSSAVGLTAAWSNQVLSLSAQTQGVNPAPAAWRDAVVLKGSDWTWDDLRSLVGA